MEIQENPANNERKERENSRSRRMRQQVMEGANAETAGQLEQVFAAKLSVLRQNEKALAAVNDPYARKVLENMIQEERSQLLYLAELTELMEEGSDMGRIGRMRRQLTHRLRTGGGKNLAYGLGAVLAGALLLPAMRDTLRPLGVKVAEGIMDLSERAQALVAGVREDMEDMVSEAQFEKFKQSIDAEMEEETGPEPPFHS